MSDEGQVRLHKAGAVATVTFDRPAARNAMTWQMYDQLSAVCADIKEDTTLRCAVFRGAGGKAFVAGSDISQFLAFNGADDGLAYEARMDRQMDELTSIAIPTVAVVEGWAVGAGINFAAGCDLRIATTGARFGVPIARTVGNCLSMATMQRLVSGFGAARVKRMLLLAEFVSADEALAAGFLARVVEPDALEDTVAAVVETLVSNAPLTMRVTKSAISRIASGTPGDGHDLIETIYGSRDFKTGVTAFTRKEKPQWEGR